MIAMPPPENLSLPPAPAWAGDIVTFSQALDAWLADLRQRCGDQEWVHRYREAMGEPAVETPLPPYPNAGDEIGWRGWWKHYNATFAAAGASADGIDDPPPAHRLSRKGRRNRWRRAVGAVVRQVLLKEIPAIAGALGRRAP
jgi:hypothetical protein